MIFKKAIATAVHVFGIFVLFCGATTFILGIAMHIDSSSAESKSGIPIAFFSLSFIIPGLFLYIRSKKMRRNIELMQTIAGMIISHRRIKIIDVAAQLQIPEQLAAKILAAAIENGIVQGKFDRTTGEFFTEEAEQEVSGIRYCPSCGAPLDKVYLKGETIQCRSCGTIVS